MKKKIIAAVVVLCTVALTALIAYDYFWCSTYSANYTAMNTVISTNITGGPGAKKAQEEIKAEIQRLDTKLLSRTAATAEVYKLNSGEVTVSDELAEILAEIKAIEANSGYAFCVGVGQLTDLWAIGTPEANIPAQDRIDKAVKSSTGWQIKGNLITIPDGVMLDLGAAGKGLACDYAKKALEKRKCQSAVITVGGSVMLYSSNKAEEFKIGIRNPQGNANEHAATLTLNSCFVSTSGNYEKFFEQGNKRYHHIFNPKTGYPAESGIQSVTVISQSGLLSDALSTACFVLGIEKSLPLLEKYSAQAVFITNDNRFITTPGLQGLEITDKNFTL